jgi:hypothetical protein
LPIAQRLADVLARDSFTLTEVSNRSRHSQDAVIRPRRQVKRLRTLDEKPTSICGEVASLE